MGTIGGQFVGHMLGRDALRNAVQHLDDRRIAIAGLPPNCTDQQIEDRATVPTAINGNDGSSLSVGRLICAKRMATRTA
jgi:hypothetical protein